MFNKPLARKPYSSHPDDSFLEVVLHTNFKDEYCTHILNKQTGGFNHGHYFGKDSKGLEDSLKDFNERGVKTKLNELERAELGGDLLAVIRQLTFALETAVNLGGGLSPVSRQELAKYVAIGQKVLKNHGIEY